ncbi:MAG: DUF4258 domain-containing protein [Parachlamydia sp.]|nr:DUF4258 domain-containing protein [Parachlamydia sp.]
MKPKRPEKLENVLEHAKSCIDKGNYIATFHAECRQLERDITLLDALHVIKTGFRDKRHDQYKDEFNSWNYAITGQTLQCETIRVIISFDSKTRMLIITVINITKKDY